MKKLLGIAAATLVFTSAAAPAFAYDHRGGGYYRGYDRGYDRSYRRDNHGDAVAAGIVGLAVGALIGSAASQPRYAPAPPPPRYDYGDRYGYYEPQRTCIERERQWDPYVGRTLTIERRYPC